MTVSDTSGIDAQTFGSAMGQAVWLMTMSKLHRDLPIRDIEKLVATPILLKQFKLYSKDKQPVAFLSWASVSDAINDGFSNDSWREMELADWRSGPNLVVVDCVSPFADRQVFVDRFLEGHENASARGELDISWRMQ